jgi:multicomponent Na+:H+ antiporter subunit F
MNWILGIMLAAMASTILHFFRSESLWERLVALASMSSKAGLAMLACGVMRGDGAVVFVGVIILSMGNAGIIIVSYLFRRLKIECK